jgi:hypothetical protein
MPLSRMSIDFMLGEALPPLLEEGCHEVLRLPPIHHMLRTMEDGNAAAEARELQRQLNSNPPRACKTLSVQRTEKRKRGCGKRGQSGKRQLYVIKDIVAVDPLAGQVFAVFEGGGGEWMPYMYLRWFCPTYKDKKELMSSVRDLLLKKEPGAPPSEKYDSLPRTAIVYYSDIKPLNYIPGIKSGDSELLRYRLRGRPYVGITRLDLIREAYSANRKKLSALEAFVEDQKREMRRARGDRAKLIALMGLFEKHDDLFKVRRDYNVKGLDSWYERFAGSRGTQPDAVDRLAAESLMALAKGL